jgi:phage tail sheath protein FI
MTIEHKLIPDSERHEPKGASTAFSGQVYVSNGSQSGVWRKLRESDMDYSSASSNVYGWNDIADNLYTSSNKRSLTSGARVQLTNNASGVQTDQSRLGNIWVPASNHFMINSLNSSYTLRVNMKATSTSASGVPYTLKIELDSANGPFTIAAHDVFFKGGSYVNDISFSIPFYLGSAVNNNGVRLFVTPDTAVSIYDVGFVIQRLYKES